MPNCACVKSCSLKQSYLVTNPLISIIIPSYNSEEHIKNTINSILQQTYDNYELIIQDSLSDDNTIDIIKSYTDPRIKLYIEKDNGINDAIYRGLKKSNGEYIMYMPSSDEYVEDNWSFCFSRYCQLAIPYSRK